LFGEKAGAEYDALFRRIVNLAPAHLSGLGCRAETAAEADTRRADPDTNALPSCKR